MTVRSRDTEQAAQLSRVHFPKTIDGGVGVDVFCSIYQVQKRPKDLFEGVRTKTMDLVVAESCCSSADRLLPALRLFQGQPSFSRHVWNPSLGVLTLNRLSS